MANDVKVAIIGAGQAGLATSWYLKQAGVEHVVLEAGRVAETWRTRRWDSFCLVTPNWSVKLPGATYAGPHPDGFMSLTELIDYFQRWADSFHAPIEKATVDELEHYNGRFRLRTGDRELLAETVVVASGAYQKAHLPSGAGSLPSGVFQLLAEDYSNPASLPTGGVLIVGSGQTGSQLAEELHEAGRQVFVACGRCPWAPRRLGGKDIVWWAVETGFFDRTVDVLPSPAARLVGNILTTGHGGGHDLHLRTLRDIGVELLGHFEGADGDVLRFADDLAASTDFSDARLRDLWKWIENYCAKTGYPLPEFDWPEPLRIPTRTSISVAGDGIRTVIWTSGYRPSYGWVKVPVFDDMGWPVTRDGASDVPGLYFAGVHWMRKMKSAILYGVGEDAQLVANHIIENRI
ncbi:MAG TPA: NAD(P)-binding domain-containing protein [Candidatus Dormibacteraeota bacterium]|nr:NAD(P)-binding domain-containing protein [Candidatus Dormibacteraeota bacterium]